MHNLGEATAIGFICCVAAGALIGIGLWELGGWLIHHVSVGWSP